MVQQRIRLMIDLNGHNQIKWNSSIPEMVARQSMPKSATLFNDIENNGLFFNYYVPNAHMTYVMMAT